MTETNPNRISEAEHALREAYRSGDDQAQTDAEAEVRLAVRADGHDDAAVNAVIRRAAFEVAHEQNMTATTVQVRTALNRSRESLNALGGAVNEWAREWEPEMTTTAETTLRHASDQIDVALAAVEGVVHRTTVDALGEQT